MDPNTNPLNPAPVPGAGAATPAPAPAVPTPDPAASTPDSAAAASDPVAELSSLANELNNYDATAELSSMGEAAAPGQTSVPPLPTSSDASVVSPTSAGVPGASPALDTGLAAAMGDPSASSPAASPMDPSVNPAALAAPDVSVSADDSGISGLAQPSPDLVAGINTPVGVVGVAAAASPQAPADAASPMGNGAPQDFAAQSGYSPSPADASAASVPPAAPGAVDPVTGAPLPNNPAQAATTEAPAAPIQAAAPVPGSIGSLKSYADIQRAEAERQAKAAAAAAAKQNGQKQGLKIGGKTISIPTLIIIAVVLVAAIVGAVVLIITMSGGSSSGSQTGNKPTQTPSAPVVTAPVKSTLVCTKNLTAAEYGEGWGVLTASRTNTLIFEDDILQSLSNKYTYNMETPELASAAKATYDAEHPWTNSTNGAFEETTEIDDATGAPVAIDARALISSVTTSAIEATYSVTETISEENIEAWLDSDYYSDSDYGLKITDKKHPEDDRTLDGYTDAQEKLGYTCTVSEK